MSSQNKIACYKKHNKSSYSNWKIYAYHPNTKNKAYYPYTQANILPLRVMPLAFTVVRPLWDRKRVCLCNATSGEPLEAHRRLPPRDRLLFNCRPASGPLAAFV